MPPFVILFWHIFCREISTTIDLLRSFGFKPVVRQRQARLVAVPSIFVQHALGDGVVDRGQGRVKQISGGGGIPCGDRGAQAGIRVRTRVRLARLTSAR